jgi:hypothetical protein
VGAREVEVLDDGVLIDDEEADASVFPLMRQVLPTPTEAVAGQADDYAFEEHHLSELITSSPITVGSNTGEDNSIEQERQFNLHEEDFTPHQGFHPSLSRIGEEEDIVNGDEVTSFHMQSEIEEDTPDESTCMKSTNPQLEKCFLACQILFFLHTASEFSCHFDNYDV